MVLCLNWRLGVAKFTHTNPNLAAGELPHKCIQYHHPLYVTCEAQAHWLHSMKPVHTSSYLLVPYISEHSVSLILRHPFVQMA